jgi:hypothetical protein
MTNLLLSILAVNVVIGVLLAIIIILAIVAVSLYTKEPAPPKFELFGPVTVNQIRVSDVFRAWNGIRMNQLSDNEISALFDLSLSMNSALFEEADRREKSVDTTYTSFVNDKRVKEGREQLNMRLNDHAKSKY